MILIIQSQIDIDKELRMKNRQCGMELTTGPKVTFVCMAFVNSYSNIVERQSKKGCRLEAIFFLFRFCLYKNIGEKIFAFAFGMVSVFIIAVSLFVFFGMVILNRSNIVGGYFHFLIQIYIIILIYRKVRYIDREQIDTM